MILTNRISKDIFIILIAGLLWCTVGVMFAQEHKPRERYLRDESGKLQIIVHIWGEVNHPSDYIVPDGTNVLELISKAGGPTEFANLSKIQITREVSSFIVERKLMDVVEAADQDKLSKESLEKSLKKQFSQRIVEVDIKCYLEEPNTITPLPTLKPGDIVVVKKNLWYKWRSVVKLAHELAIIASVYVWYLRAEQWK
jgi:hypothetical protein